MKNKNKKFKKLSNVYCKKIKPETIVFTKKTKLWCQLPYNNHSCCMNYNKNKSCPPHSPYLEELKNYFNYFYLVYLKFNFKAYKLIRKKEHPNWSKKQLENLLWWQRPVTNILRDKIIDIFLNNKNKLIYFLCSGSSISYKNMNTYQDKIYSMESVGIYVFETLKNNDIDFELKPKNTITFVSLLCSYKKLKIKINRKSVL